MNPADEVWADLRSRFPPVQPRPRWPPVADAQAGGLAHQARWDEALADLLTYAHQHLDRYPDRYRPRNRTDTTSAWNLFRAGE